MRTWACLFFVALTLCCRAANPDIPNMVSNINALSPVVKVGNGTTVGSNNVNGHPVFSVGIPVQWGSSPNAIITLSSIGVANGASVSNNGAQFGPDTPGTLTSGIQEAINILPNPIGDVTKPGGGTLQLGQGNFFVSTNIVTPNGTNPFSLTIIGSGISAGGIVGTGNHSVMVVGKPHSGTMTQFKMENLYMATMANTPTNILWINGSAVGGGTSDVNGGVARVDISYCWFSQWTRMTNNLCLGFTPSSCAPTDSLPNNVTAIFVDQNYSDVTTIQRCSFNYVQGVVIATPHLELLYNMFEHCGSTVQCNTNQWPFSSIVKTCGAVILTEPSPNRDRCPGGGVNNDNKFWDIRGNNFVNCSVPFIFNDGFDAASGNHHAIFNVGIETAGTILPAIGTFGGTYTFVDTRLNDGGTRSYTIPKLYLLTNCATYTTNVWQGQVSTTNFTFVNH